MPLLSAKPEEYQVEAVARFACMALHARSVDFPGDQLGNHINAHSDYMRKNKSLDYERSLTFSVMIHLSANRQDLPI